MIKKKNPLVIGSLRSSFRSLLKLTAFYKVKLLRHYYDIMRENLVGVSKDKPFSERLTDKYI